MKTRYILSNNEFPLLNTSLILEMRVLSRKEILLGSKNKFPMIIVNLLIDWDNHFNMITQTLVVLIFTFDQLFIKWLILSIGVKWAFRAMIAHDCKRGLTNEHCHNHWDITSGDNRSSFIVRFWFRKFIRGQCISKDDGVALDDLYQLNVNSVPLMKKYHW